MSNLLTNCGFLDGTAGWDKSAQLTLAIDEATRGAPGRAALLGSGATTATGQKQWIAPTAAARAVVTAGQEIEVSAGVLAMAAAAVQTPTARLVWFDGAAAEIDAAELTVQAPQIDRYGAGLHGVRSTWYRAFGRAIAPTNTARAAVEVSLTPAASGTAVTLGLLKPMLGLRVAGRDEPLAFDPGVHANADLNLPVWPGELQPFEVGPGGERNADRAEFQSGAASPISRRTSADPARRFSGQLRCDPLQRAMLEAFWASESRFWIVEPDSDRLCVASFAADGAPRMTEDLGVESRMAVELWLETA